MTWINSFSSIEYTFLLIFILLYTVYLLRVYFVGRKLGGASRSVFGKFILRFAYLLLLIGALLGPTFGDLKSDSMATGKELYIAIDLSRSMDANDVQPSRLEKVKFELTTLVERLKNNRIGLITFSSEAFVHTPLTYDTDALKLFINQLSTNLLEGGSSHLNTPLMLAIQKFSGISNKHVKTVLLISDGEDWGGLTDSTIRQLKNNKINVFLLGIGTTQGGRIPQGNSFKKEANGNEIITKLNAAFMQSVAIKTGGKYFRLSQEKNDIDALVESINALENTEIDMRKVMIANNRYYYFLWLALLLIFFDIVFTIKVLKI